MIADWVCNPTAPGDRSDTGDESMQAFNCHDLASRTVITLSGEIPAGDRSHLAALTDGAAIVGGCERGWSTVGLYRFRGELLPPADPCRSSVPSAGTSQWRRGCSPGLAP